MSQVQLTLELINQICSFIRAGGYPHVAAEAAGVSGPLFAHWLKRGRKTKSADVYRLLYKEAQKAHAFSRLAAETRTYHEDPLSWLKTGPGRDAPNRPGWGNRGRSAAATEADNGLLHPQTQALVTTVLRLLEPYPEVRVSVSQALLAKKLVKGHARTSNEAIPENTPPEVRAADSAGDDRALSGVSP